jgi:hypothetical protein
VKKDLSFMPITKLKKIKNKMDLLVGAIVLSYCEEGLKYCECDIHSQQPCCVIHIVMHGHWNHINF